jgi:hypothetical protein
MKKLTYYFFTVLSLYLAYQLGKISYMEIMNEHVSTSVLFAVLALGATQIPELLKPTKNKQHEEH